MKKVSTKKERTAAYKTRKNRQAARNQKRVWGE